MDLKQILLILEKVVAVDVDDSLIMWEEPKDLTKFKEIFITDSRDGKIHRVWIHLAHVQFVKDQHALGRSVIVWSQGGASWVSDVVQALGLAPFIKLGMSKPFAFVDDLDSHFWMENRVWIGKEPRLGSNIDQGLENLDSLDDYEIF